MSAQINRDDAGPVAEPLYLRHPHVPVKGKTVKEDHGEAYPLVGIGESDAVHAGMGHGPSMDLRRSVGTVLYHLVTSWVNEARMGRADHRLRGISVPYRMG